MKQTIIIFIILFLFQISKSQNSGLHFENLTVKDGLSQNATDYVMQDSKGFIWIAAQNGLNRFDGYSFKMYEYNPNDNTSLYGSFVIRIAEDKKGYLWVGTTIGLSRFDRKTETFKNYRLNNNINSDFEVRKIMITENNDLYVCTVSNGLLKLNTSDDKMFPVEIIGIQDSVKRFIISDLHMENDSIMWLGTNIGLLKFNVNTTTVIEILSYKKDNTNSILENKCNVVMLDNKKFMWVGHDLGITKIDYQNKTFKQYSSKSSTKENPIPKNVMNLFQDHSGNIWIGTESDGLYLYDFENDKFIQYKHKVNEPNSISSNRIYHIIEDKSKVLWIATRGGGICKTFIDKKKFHIINKNSDNSLINNDIFGITEDIYKNLWFAAIGGVSKYNPTTNLFTNYSEFKNSDKTILSNLNWTIVKEMFG